MSYRQWCSQGVNVGQSAPPHQKKKKKMPKIGEKGGGSGKREKSGRKDKNREGLLPCLS